MAGRYWLWYEKKKTIQFKKCSTQVDLRTNVDLCYFYIFSLDPPGLPPARSFDCLFFLRTHVVIIASSVVITAVIVTVIAIQFCMYHHDDTTAAAAVIMAVTTKIYNFIIFQPSRCKRSGSCAPRRCAKMVNTNHMYVHMLVRCFDSARELPPPPSAQYPFRPQDTAPSSSPPSSSLPLILVPAPFVQPCPRRTYIHLARTESEYDVPVRRLLCCMTCMYARRACITSQEAS